MNWEPRLRRHHHVLALEHLDRAGAQDAGDVLLGEGLVEPELLTQRLVAGDVGRLLAEDRAGRVAGQSLRSREDDDRDQE